MYKKNKLQSNVLRKFITVYTEKYTIIISNIYSFLFILLIFFFKYIDISGQKKKKKGTRSCNSSLEKFRKQVAYSYKYSPPSSHWCLNRFVCEEHLISLPTCTTFSASQLNPRPEQKMSSPSKRREMDLMKLWVFLLIFMVFLQV